MKGLSNGFYILVAIVSVLWSLISTFEMEKTPDNSVRSGKKLTEISTLELNSSMLSSSENRRKLRSLHKFTIKSDSKIRIQAETTAFVVGRGRRRRRPPPPSNSHGRGGGSGGGGTIQK